MSFAIVDLSESKWNLKTKIEYYADRIEIYLPLFSLNKSNKYSKKVIKILNRNSIREVVLNKNLLNNRIFCENLVNAKKQVIIGRKIYKTIILRVLKDISNQMNYDFYKFKIALLINEYSAENIDLIRIIAKEVKALTIVTNDKNKFNIIEKELFDNYGIILKVIENTDANLKNCNVIVNVDFQSYEVDKIVINNKSLIICGFAKNYEVKKNFDGIIIRNIEVLDPKNMNQNIEDLSLCEAKVYSYLKKLKQNDRTFEREGFRVNGYFGQNGKLTAEDFKKFGQKIVQKSS